MVTASRSRERAATRRAACSARSTRRLWHIDMTGYERLPDDGPAILCPNHISFLDSAFLMLTVPRNISFVGKAEYMDSWKTKYVFPAMGMIPIDRSGGEKSQSALDAAGRGAAARRAVRHLPRGHAQPRRPAVQGPHRRRPAGAGGRLPDLPGRHHRHRRDPAAGRQGAQAVQVVLDHDRPAGPPRALPRPARAAPGVALDDRRGDVRDPRDDRPGVPQPLRRRGARDVDRAAGRRPPGAGSPTRCPATRSSASSSAPAR